MARTPKYRPKYAKELRDGLRLCYETNMSIDRCCLHWKITPKTYHNWKKEYTSFAEACEIGERDYRIAWEYRIMCGINGSGNSQLLKVYAANVLGLSDKKVVENKNEEQIHKVEINVLPTPDRTNKLEDNTEQSNNNIIDITEYDEARNKPDPASS